MIRIATGVVRLTCDVRTVESLLRLTWCPFDRMALRPEASRLLLGESVDRSTSRRRLLELSDIWEDLVV